MSTLEKLRNGIRTGVLSGGSAGLCANDSFMREASKLMCKPCAPTVILICECTIKATYAKCRLDTRGVRSAAYFIIQPIMHSQCARTLTIVTARVEEKKLTSKCYDLVL